MDIYLKILDQLEELRMLAEEHHYKYTSEAMAQMCKNVVNSEMEYQLHSDLEKVYESFFKLQYRFDAEDEARMCSASFAHYAGYESRAKWIDKLMENDESRYFQKFKRSPGYAHYLKAQQVRRDKIAYMKELSENGNTVWNMDGFTYSKVQIGDYVDQDIVDEAMNMLPPASMSRSCSQMGEPYSCREDPDSGVWKNTYATFKYVDRGIWQYCGNCFRGETVERSKEPVYA